MSHLSFPSLRSFILHSIDLNHTSLLQYSWPLKSKSCLHVGTVPLSWEAESSCIPSSGGMITHFVLFLAFMVAKSEIFSLMSNSFGWLKPKFYPVITHDYLDFSSDTHQCSSPVSKMDATTIIYVFLLENKTSLATKRFLKEKCILTSSSRKGAKHPVEQRDNSWKER